MPRYSPYHLLLLASQPPIDTTSTSGCQAAASTYNWSHSCTGNNRLLTTGVGILSVIGNSVSGITYNSISLSSQITKANGIYRAELWSLVAPTAGSNTDAVTLASLGASTAGAVSYGGVDQTTPIGATASASGTSATASLTIVTTKANSWIIDCVATSALAGTTVGTGQNQRWLTACAAGTAGSSDQGPFPTVGTSVTMQWTGLAITDLWSIVAMEVEPTVAAAAATVIQRRTLGPRIGSRSS